MSSDNGGGGDGDSNGNMWSNLNNDEESITAAAAGAAAAASFQSFPRGVGSESTISMLSPSGRSNEQSSISGISALDRIGDVADNLPTFGMGYTNGRSRSMVESSPQNSRRSARSISPRAGRRAASLSHVANGSSEVSISGGQNHQAMLRQQARMLLSSAESRRPVHENARDVALSRVQPQPDVQPRRQPQPQQQPPDNADRQNAAHIDEHPRANRNEQERQIVPERSNVSDDDEDDDDFQSNHSGWTMVEINAGTPPSARSLHASAILNGVMYVFAGYDGSQRVNSFHAFSFAEKRWSPVLPSAESDDPPSPRDRHVAVAFGNSFYVHGGFDGRSRVGDFYNFDFSSMTWQEVPVLQGRPPSPRHSHAAVVHRNSIYIFGGYDGSYKSDLHEFDIIQSQWNAVPAIGRRPRARYRTTAVVHQNSMILAGGHDGTRHLLDCHVFDFVSRMWSALVTEGPPPKPRDSHISVVYGNSMYLYGGSGGSAMCDLHELQLPITPSAPAKWRPVNTAVGEPTSHRFCHTAVVFNESIFCFGGYNGSQRLDHFTQFDLALHDLSFEVPEPSLTSELRGLVDNEMLSDVTFMVEGNPVYAHKLMLTRCSYFKALFLGEMRESRQSTITIEQVSHPIFLQVLEYLYTDQLRIPFESAMELFQAADLFCIPRLQTMCEKRMLQYIVVENAAAIFHAADIHSAMVLRQKAKKYILSHFEAVSKTECFEEMGRSNVDLVFELLRSR